MEHTHVDLFWLDSERKINHWELTWLDQGRICRNLKCKTEINSREMQEHCSFTFQSDFVGSYSIKKSFVSLPNSSFTLIWNLGIQMKWWFWSQNSEYENMSYPDILRRGELESRGDEREEEEKEQRHISFKRISNSEFFFLHSWWNELSGVAETFAVSESAVVALLLQLRLPPPPVAPITAGGAVSPSGSCKTWPPSLPPLSSPHHFFLLLWLRQTGGSEVTWWRFLCGSVTSPQLCVSVLSMAMMRQYTMWVVAATRWPPPRTVI